MSNTPAQDKLEDRLKKVFNDPATQAAVVDAVVTNKPAGWSRRSVAPYYKEKYARRLKPVIDEMMQDGKPVVYDYKEVKDKLNISKSTLYLLINQSMHYLVDKMDTEDKRYAKFCETLTIHQERNVGVVLRIDVGFAGEDENALMPKKITYQVDAPKWKEELLSYLENAKPGDKPFHKDGLCLNVDEIAQLKQAFAPLGESILFSLTSYSIKVIKVNKSAL